MLPLADFESSVPSSVNVSASLRRKSTAAAVRAKLARARLGAGHDRQPDEPVALAALPIVEAVTARFALRGVRPNVSTGFLDRGAESEGGDVQVLAVAADHHGIASERFDAIDAVDEGDALVRRARRGKTRRENRGLGGP